MGLLDDAIREHLDLKRRRGADPTEIERAEREALGPVRRGPMSAADAMPSGDPLHDAVHAPTHTQDQDWDHAEPHGGPDDFDLEPDFHDDLPAPSSPLAADLAASPLHREDPPPARLGPEPKSRGRGFFRRHHAEPEVELEPVTEREPDPPEVRFEPRPVTPAPAAAPQHFDEEDDWDDEDDPFAGPAADLDIPPAGQFDEPPPARPAPPAPAASRDPYPAIPPPAAASPPPSPAAEPPGPPRRPVPREDLMGETVEYDVEQAFHESAEEDVLEETPEFLQDTPDHDRLWFEQKPPKDFDFDG